MKHNRKADADVSAVRDEGTLARMRTHMRARHWMRHLAVLLGLILVGVAAIVHRACPVWKQETVAERVDSPTASDWIAPDGQTQQTRILPPEGFARTAVSPESFAAFLREQPLYPDGSAIYLYNGQAIDAPNAVAVYRMDTGTKNFQQCADSIIRMYSEYYWQRGQTDKIAFHTTSGFLLDYDTWRSGKRAVVLGDFVRWVKLAGQDDSYEQFRSYLYMVMRYAGTKSLEAESTPLAPSELEIGDMYCKGGAPGHAILVVDKAVNAQGEACFLLAQGMMPAQSFHILCKPDDDPNPWYTTAELQAPFTSPGGFAFSEEHLRRWGTGFPTDAS